MKPIVLPPNEIKLTLLNLAESGYRIDHLGMCLFAGFHMNQNWEARGKVLRERLEKYAVEGATFTVLACIDEPGEAIGRWSEVNVYVVGSEIEP